MLTEFKSKPALISDDKNPGRFFLIIDRISLSLFLLHRYQLQKKNPRKTKNIRMSSYNYIFRPAIAAQFSAVTFH